MGRAGCFHQHNVAGLELVRHRIERGRGVGHGERLAGPGRHPPRAGQQRLRLGADRDQPGQFGPGGELADGLVAGLRGIAQLGHVAEDGEPAPAGGQVTQGRQGGPDRLGIGVVGVVDDRHPICPAVDFHPPPAARYRGAQGIRGIGQAQAELAGQGRGGQGIRHVMRAMQPQGDRRRAVGCQQGEARPPEVVQPHVRRAHAGLGRLDAEGDDPGRGPGGHGRHAGVVGVQDGRAVGRERLDQLALGPGHLVQAAELPGVRVAHVQHRAVAGRGDTAQVGDVPGSAGRQLEHQVPGRGVGAEHGQRQAELVVERPGGRDRGAQALGQLGGQVLGGGLARGPGDARDPRRGQRVDHVPGQRGQGGRDVGHQDRGHRHGPGSQCRHRPRRHGVGGEVVPVGPLPRDRREQAAGTGPPGVDHHLAGHDRGGFGVQLPAGDPGHLGQRQRDHGSTAHGSANGWPLATRSRAAAVTCRSSNGRTLPATY